jgi:hypothetical protein
MPGRASPRPLQRAETGLLRGAGGTVDSVIPFHYVKPGVENDQSTLESITGVSGIHYRRWNAELSDFEQGYHAAVKLGGHSGELSLVRDLKMDQVQKGHQRRGSAV